MRVVCLSDSPHGSAFLLFYNGLTILLDAPLDFSSLLKFLPSLSLCSSLGGERPPKRRRSTAGRPLADCFVERRPDDVLVKTDAVQFVGLDVSELDKHRIDVVLLSHAWSMLALPYVTEYGAFAGQILCTEQTLEIGRQLMEDLLTASSSSTDPAWQLADQLATVGSQAARTCLAALASAARPLYSRSDVAACLQRCTAVSYGESVVLADGSVTATPYSSGYAIGAANWLLTSNAGHKICYVAASSLHDDLHPCPLVTFPLHTADLLIVADLACSAQPPAVAAPSPPLSAAALPADGPTAGSSAASQSSSATSGQPSLDGADVEQQRYAGIADMCTLVGQTIASGGTALLPVYPSGPIFDYFERIVVHLASTGFRSVPMFFVSATGARSLGYANIAGQVLSRAKQTRIFLPDQPLVHDELLRTGALLHSAAIASDGAEPARSFGDLVKSGPSVIFAGHPSLRCGEMVQLLRLFRHSPASTLVCTVPEFCAELPLCLAPYQPLQLRVVSCPVDSRLTASQAAALIGLLRPRHVLLNARWPSCVPSQQTKQHQQPVPIVHTYAAGARLHLPIARTSIHGVMTAELAKRLFVDPEPAAGPAPRLLQIDAAAVMREPSAAPGGPGSVVLSPLPPLRRIQADSAGEVSRRRLYGRPLFERVLAALFRRGIPYEIAERGQQLRLPSLQASVVFEPQQTTITQLYSDRPADSKGILLLQDIVAEECQLIDPSSSRS